jgi:hypothetical protein
VYVCTYVRMYVCMYVLMYPCMYTCMHVYMYVCMYVLMYIPCVCMHVCMYLNTCVCTYVHTHVYMYVCTKDVSFLCSHTQFTPSLCVPQQCAISTVSSRSDSLPCRFTVLPALHTITFQCTNSRADTPFNVHQVD